MGKENTETPTEPDKETRENPPAESPNEETTTEETTTPDESQPVEDKNSPKGDTPDGSKAPDDMLLGEQDDAGEGDENAPVLEYKAPDGVELNDEANAMISDFTDAAKDMGLGQDHFQRSIEWLREYADKANNASADNYFETIEGWRQATLKDPDIYQGSEAKYKENMALAKTALELYASPGLVELLQSPSETNNGFGLINHPEMVKLFLRIGKASREDSMVSGNPANPDGGGGGKGGAVNEDAALFSESMNPDGTPKSKP